MADAQIPPDAPQCKNCRFWRTISETYAQGECRKNPPTFIAWESGSESGWPIVGGGAWCGQHDR